MDLDKKLIVFDLDYTLWPLHVDECATPFTKSRVNDSILDSHGRVCYLYKDTINILRFLKKKKYIVAIASRARNICGSYQLLHLFGVADYFRYKEIYPGTKKHHFNVLALKSNISFENMIFFDNDHRNIKEVEKLGVKCNFLTEEISLKFVCTALNPKKKDDTPIYVI